MTPNAGVSRGRGAHSRGRKASPGLLKGFTVITFSREAAVLHFDTRLLNFRPQAATRDCARKTRSSLGLRRQVQA